MILYIQPRPLSFRWTNHQFSFVALFQRENVPFYVPYLSFYLKVALLQNNNTDKLIRTILMPPICVKMCVASKKA